MPVFDVSRYLKRIGYTGDLVPSARTLRELQTAHLRAVPYENLEILEGREPAMDATSVYDKIVQKRRGGWCYELNILFAQLLRALGFRLDILSARIFRDGVLGPEFDHIILLVHLDERWIADVGNARWSLEPILLDETRMHTEGERLYRFDRADETYTLLLSEGEGLALPQYLFNLMPCTEQDFRPMSRLKATSPDSRFTQRRICSLHTDSGQIILNAGRLITYCHGQRHDRQLQDRAEEDEIVRDVFRL